MSTISAGTTSGTALVNSGDTTGNLVLQVNGTTTAVTLDTAKSMNLSGSYTESVVAIGTVTTSNTLS